MNRVRSMAAGAAAEPAPRQVMLLSLWQGDGTEWRARLVGTDGVVHEFTSPFELARFLSRPPWPTHAPAPGGGLR
jgi:hypothetical protein